jgi:hypothetical protein
MTRVLMLTMLYTSKKFTGISMVNYFRDLISCVRRVAPGEFHWTLAVPSTHEYIQWSEEELCGGYDDIAVLPILAKDTVNRAKDRDGFAGVDFQIFSPEAFRFFVANRAFEYDVILSNYYHVNNIPGILSCSVLSRQFRLTPRVAPPAVVNLLTETGVDTHLPFLDTDTARNSIVCGILSSYATVVLNRLDRDWARGVLRERCSASFFSWQDIRHILPPVDLAAVPVCTRPKDRATFFHGGSFEGKRHIDVMVDAVGSAVGFGRDCSLVLTTQFLTEDVPDYARRSFIDLRCGIDREAYLDALSDGDFLLCAADYEGTGLAYMEAIVSGMTPIIWSRPWIAERIPVNYPFICHSAADFRAAIAYCAAHPAGAKVKGREAIAHVRGLYDPDVNGNVWAGLLRDVVAARNERTRKVSRDHFLIKLAQRAWASSDKRKLSWAGLMKLIEESAEKLTVKELETIRPFLRAALLANGFVESVEGWDFSG